MSNAMDKRERLLALIAKALAGVSEEIQKANKGEQALDGVEQLRFMQRKLNEMKATLNRDDWQSIQRTKPGIARLVIDTWPMNDFLGNLISEIEYEYGRLK